MVRFRNVISQAKKNHLTSGISIPFGLAILLFALAVSAAPVTQVRMGTEDRGLEGFNENYPDTTRFTIIINGQRQSERRMWQTGPNTWHFEHKGDAFHFPRTERLILDTEGGT